MRRLLLAMLFTGSAACGTWIDQTQAAEPLDEITLTLENARFSPEELRVKAGAPFMLVITNRDSADNELEIQSLQIEKPIPAGRTRRVKMPALPPGSYRFVAERAQVTAKGRLTAF